MGGSRLVFVVAALAICVGVVFAVFREDLGQRALPPQANIPELPAQTSPPAGEKNPVAATVVVEPPTFDIVRVSRNCTAVIAVRAPASALVTVKSGDRELGCSTADARCECALVPESGIAPDITPVNT